MTSLTSGTIATGDYGMISVSGSASIAAGSSIQIIPTGNVIVPSNSTFTIVAGNAASAFSTTTILPGLTETFTSATVGNALVITATPQTFASGVGGGVAANLATILTELAANPATASQYQPIVTSIEQIEASQGATAAADAISLLAPAPADMGVSSSIDITSQLSDAIGQQVGGVDTSMNGSGVLGKSAGAGDPSNALWGRVIGSNSNRSSNSGFNGFNANSYGLVIGGDTMVAPNLKLGLAGSWGYGTFTGDQLDSGDTGNVNSYQGTAYANWTMGQFGLNGQVGYGGDSFKESRNLATLGLGTASGTYNGDQWLARLEAEYAIPMNGMQIIPFAALRYLSLHTDSYTESGAGAGDLTVAGATYNSWQSNAGATASWTIPTSFGRFVPQVKLAWLHDFNEGSWQTSASLGGIAFETPAAKPSSDGLGAVISGSLYNNYNTSVELEYEGDLRSNYRSNAGFLQLKQAF